MDSLYIVMPAYNEEANIEAVVKDWYKILEGKDPASRLVVADSGSTDSTHELLVKMQENYPQLEILTDCEKQHGPKLLALYQYAIDQKADYIFQTDSDGQTDPGEFDKFWELRGRYEAVVGKRPVRGDGASRLFVEKVLCFLLQLNFGVRVPDANAPFRLMKRGLVARHIDRFPENYDIPNAVFTAFFVYFKENITFLDITFKPRQGGTNSINVKRIIQIGKKAVSDFYGFRKALKNNN